MATNAMRQHTAHNAWQRACDTRDAAFDGVFFVAITSTKIYCRPICPSPRARPERRRFFTTADDAARAGYRPCKRCRPELAPGNASTDAVRRIANTAAQRIADGALDHQRVADLAAELGVSDRQLRRAVAKALGTSIRDLAQRARLRRAQSLLRRTTATVSAVAYQSGFRSLRRFNDAFRRRFGTAPTTYRKQAAASHARSADNVREAAIDPSSATTATTIREITTPMAAIR